VRWVKAVRDLLRWLQAWRETAAVVDAVDGAVLVRSAPAPVGLQTVSDRSKSTCAPPFGVFTRSEIGYRGQRRSRRFKSGHLHPSGPDFCCWTEPLNGCQIQFAPAACP
jgi:hypothetical protein